MKRIWIILWLLLAAAGNVAFAEQIIYVDADANGLNDGTGWIDAYKYLQDALADANSSTKPIEIRVAQGTYRPDEDTLHPGGTGNRESTFHLINGVTIKGGYAGFGQPDPNARDTVLYQTILSGDIGKLLVKSDNSYHIFYHPKGLNLDDTAILDGFTITGGNATNAGSVHDSGGGMFNDESSPNVNNCNFSGNSAVYGGGMFNYETNPNVNNCTFNKNSAVWVGGGMFNYVHSSPKVNNCTFSENSSYDGGGMYNNYYSSPKVEGCTFNGNSAESGGGMLNWDSSPTVKGCTFIGNSAVAGGGMGNSESSPTVTNCTFTFNSADWGGGMGNGDSSPTINNCTFTGNSADWDGGGMGNRESSPIIANCTFSGNFAKEHGGGIYNYRYSSPTVSNCILWADVPSEISSDVSPIVTYSNVQGGWPGEGNLNKDPCFAYPNNGDYHLKSQAGRWNPNSKSWVKDNVTSPCIDAGDFNSDWTAELWPHGKRINIGAYGGTPEASLSLRDDVGNPADLNNDDTANLRDFSNFADEWQNKQFLLPEDLDRDGIVDCNDLSILADNWLEER